MVIPFSKLLFAVDNGLSEHLNGTGLAAEYNISKRELVWRNISKKKIAKHQDYAQLLVLVSMSLPSVMFMVTILMMRVSTKQNLDIVSAWGCYAYILPMLFGLVLFLSFEALMIYMRERYEICHAPSLNEQVQYFNGVSNATLKHNDVWSGNKVPYLANAIICFLVVSILIPVMFWLYLTPSSHLEFVVKFIILGILLSLIPNMVWNFVVKSILLNKICLKIKENGNAR